MFLLNQSSNYLNFSHPSSINLCKYNLLALIFIVIHVVGIPTRVMIRAYIA